MPKSTSAWGLPLVRIAWFTTVPASPPWITSTSMPVSSVKASSTPSLSSERVVGEQAHGAAGLVLAVGCRRRRSSPHAGERRGVAAAAEAASDGERSGAGHRGVSWWWVPSWPGWMATSTPVGER